MSERPRDTRFALINVAFLADPKFVRLARSLSRDRFNAAVGVWIQLLCAARQDRSPLIDWEDWSDDTQAIGDLRTARLLNTKGFEAEAFDTWGPKKTYPSDLLRNSTQRYAGLHTTTQPHAASLSYSPSLSTNGDTEGDVAESRVVMRSSEPQPVILTKEDREAKIAEQRKLLSHPHPAIARAAEKAIRVLEQGL